MNSDITKSELKQATENAKNTTKEAIETMLRALNAGQRKKILKDTAVQRLIEIYGVETK